LLLQRALQTAYSTMFAFVDVFKLSSGPTPPTHTPYLLFLI
jgi:hypothetical protein